MTVASLFRVFVGVDVSKETLDVHVLVPDTPQNSCVFSVPNTSAGISTLAQKLKPYQVQLLVVESTGGYERRLVIELLAAGLVVAVPEHLVAHDVREHSQPEQKRCASRRHAKRPSPQRHARGSTSAVGVGVAVRHRTTTIRSPRSRIAGNTVVRERQRPSTAAGAFVLPVIELYQQVTKGGGDGRRRRSCLALRMAHSSQRRMT